MINNELLDSRLQNHLTLYFQTEALNVTKWQDHEKDHISSMREFQCGYCKYITTSQVNHRTKSVEIFLKKLFLLD